MGIFVDMETFTAAQWWEYSEFLDWFFCREIVASIHFLETMLDFKKYRECMPFIIFFLPFYSVKISLGTQCLFPWFYTFSCRILL